MDRRFVWLYAIGVSLSMMAIPLGGVTGLAAGTANAEQFTDATAAYQINLPRADNLVPDERTALMALYNSTRGSDWLYNVGWSTAAPICTWYGATCDANGHVTSLILSRNGLVGELPPEIGGLHLLEMSCAWTTSPIQPASILFAAKIALRGLIPGEIRHLTALQSLDLS